MDISRVLDDASQLTSVDDSASDKENYTMFKLQEKHSSLDAVGMPNSSESAELCNFSQFGKGLRSVDLIIIRIFPLTSIFKTRRTQPSPVKLVLYQREREEGGKSEGLMLMVVRPLVRKIMERHISIPAS